MLDMRDLPCNAVVQYLYEHGWEWTKLEPNGADHVIWAARSDDRYVVFVPTNMVSGDYGHRMMRVVAALESWEGREQEEIVADILAMHVAIEASRFTSGLPPSVL